MSRLSCFFAAVGCSFVIFSPVVSAQVIRTSDACQSACPGSSNEFDIVWTSGNDIAYNVDTNISIASGLGCDDINSSLGTDVKCAIEAVEYVQMSGHRISYSFNKSTGLSLTSPSTVSEVFRIPGASSGWGPNGSAIARAHVQVDTSTCNCVIETVQGKYSKIAVNSDKILRGGLPNPVDWGDDDESTPPTYSLRNILVHELGHNYLLHNGYGTIYEWNYLGLDTMNSNYPASGWYKYSFITQPNGRTMPTGTTIDGILDSTGGTARITYDTGANPLKRVIVSTFGDINFRGQDVNRNESNISICPGSSHPSLFFVWIDNRGSYSGYVKTALRLSSNKLISSYDREAGSITSYMTGRTSAQVGVLLNVSSSTPPGTYWLGFTTDYTNSTAKAANGSSASTNFDFDNTVDNNSVRLDESFARITVLNCP